MEYWGRLVPEGMIQQKGEYNTEQCDAVGQCKTQESKVDNIDELGKQDGFFVRFLEREQ
jgi:hypothetical protein